MKRNNLNSILTTVILYFLLLNNVTAQSHVWINIEKPIQIPTQGSRFSTDIKMSVWNGNTGASDLLISYNPEEIKMTNISIPATSPFSPNVFIDSISTPGEIRIISLNIFDPSKWEKNQTIGTISWYVRYESDTITDIRIKAIDHIVSGWKSVDVESFGLNQKISPLLVSFNLNNIEGYTGNNIFLPIGLTNIIDMKAFQFTIAYDQTKMNFLNCSNFTTEIDEQNLIINNNQVEGKLSFIYSGTPINILNGTLFDLVFSLKDDVSGNVPVKWINQLNDHYIINSIPDNISAIFSDGNISILNKTEQHITFNQLTDKTYGDEPFYLSATGGTSGNMVTFESSDKNIITIVDSLVTIVGAGEAEITANQAGTTNYKSAAPVKQLLRVRKAPLLIKVDNKQKTYGSPNPDFTCQYSGFVFDENESVLEIKPEFNCNASVTSDVGTYSIIPANVEDNNYLFSYQNGNLAITKATLMARAVNKSRNYNEENPVFTIEYSGFMNEENSDVLDNKPSIICNALQSSFEGNYQIVVSGGTDNNYDLICENGTLKINSILPEISTKEAMSISNQTAVVGGVVLSSGGSNSIIKGICWNKTGNPTRNDSSIVYSQETESFTITLKNLVEKTTYFVRAFAINSAGIGYGNEVAFTTTNLGINTSLSSTYSIYPNPTRGPLFVKLNKPINSKTVIDITTLNGCVILQRPVSTTHEEFDLSNLVKGLYLLKIRSKDICEIEKITVK